MYCAHVRLEKDTVNTCRLCLSQTKRRVGIEIWDSPRAMRYACSPTRTCMMTGAVLSIRQWRSCGRSRTLFKHGAHGHGCGRVTERFHKQQPRTRGHPRTKNGPRDRVVEWTEVGTATATPCCGPSLPQTTRTERGTRCDGRWLGTRNSESLCSLSLPATANHFCWLTLTRMITTYRQGDYVCRNNRTLLAMQNARRSRIVMLQVYRSVSWDWRDRRHSCADAPADGV